ncbi:MAG: hypothetical protein WDO13_15315 [Verrucomicrobiota bacterium]
MKTTPSASTASPTSTSSPTASAGAAASASAAPRASAAGQATTITRPLGGGGADYRSNIERQAREQKAVGSILAWVVYGLIALFVIGAGLAGYGAYVITRQLRQQSATIDEVDARYALANKDLNTRLGGVQDTLTQAQAQIGRQQDLITKQQEDISRLTAALADDATAIKAERQIRLQETTSLRIRLRDLEYRTNATVPAH